jgi:PTH1 family peptidyl-tRNA hydrolase
MWLVVGLGNPGDEYARTRHNLGFMVADELAGRSGAGSARDKLGAEVREGQLAGNRVLLCKPMQYMNVSGEAVGRVAGFWKVDPTRMVVVYDDLDLPFGQLRLAGGGGHGGHNGIRSIIGTMGKDFFRVRIGIGRPGGSEDASRRVLGGFSREEQNELPFLVTEAADAVELLMRDGLIPAMNRFNKKKEKPAGAKPDKKTAGAKPEKKKTEDQNSD